MPPILITIGNYILMPFKWFWFTATLKTKLVIVALLVFLALLGYFLWQRHKIDQLQQQVEQEQLNRRLDEVNRITNQIQEKEKEGNVLSNNTNNADTGRRDVDRRQSNSFTGNSELQFCSKFCWDDSCANYRRVHECR